MGYYSQLNQHRLVVCFLINLCLSMRAEAKMLDMTYVFNASSPHYGQYRDFDVNVLNAGPFLSIPWVYFEEMSFFVHTGTHIDAPSHFDQHGRNVEDIPLEDLIGPVVVIDMRDKAVHDRDAALSVDDLRVFEDTYGRIPDRAVVVLNTGGGKLYWDADAYAGQDPGSETWHFPGFSVEAVSWLIEQRAIIGIGNDRRSFDVGAAPDFPVHQRLLSAGKFGIENLGNVDKLPTTGATLVVMPMPFHKGSGAPARILAYWDTKLLLASASGSGRVAGGGGAGFSLDGALLMCLSLLLMNAHLLHS